MLSKIFRNRKKHRANSFYQLSLTCQIPHLSDLYEKYFGQTREGVFVEVGAYDGEYVSNTSGLADIGWEGYYIEPVKDYYEKCRKRHQNNTNVVVENIAIGSKAGKKEIIIAGPLSSLSTSNVSTLKEVDWAKRHFTDDKSAVSIITLDEFLLNRNVDNNFQLLSIDVEGYELEVLKGFSVTKWKPEMIICELHDQNVDYKKDWDEANKIVKYFDRAKYKIIYKDFSNTVYVRNDL